MSVLIKGMKMPRTCAGCEWSNLSYPNAWCRLEKKKTNLEVARTQRAAFCPFIEVPTPHGRLIDAEALIKDLKECMCAANNNWEYEMVTGYSNAIESVEEADIIIEAEGSET